VVFSVELEMPPGPVYAVLDGLLAEYDSVFQYGFVHIGGDEVQNYVCWEQSAAVQAFAQANGLANSSQIRSYYGA
jgi:N-acetyl-beta-hexosaminidase